MQLSFDLMSKSDIIGNWIIILTLPNLWRDTYCVCTQSLAPEIFLPIHFNSKIFIILCCGISSKQKLCNLKLSSLHPQGKSCACNNKGRRGIRVSRFFRNFSLSFINFMSDNNSPPRRRKVDILRVQFAISIRGLF